MKETSKNPLNPGIAGLQQDRILSLPSSGIAALYNQNQEYIKAQKEAGKNLFDMVVNEEGTDDELRALVTQRSLLELLLLTIDHQKTIRARVNSQKSNEEASIVKQRQQLILHEWLDNNIQKYSGKLDTCAEQAIQQIKGLGRGYEWVRKEITAYRKNKK